MQQSCLLALSATLSGLEEALPEMGAHVDDDTTAQALQFAIAAMQKHQQEAAVLHRGLGVIVAVCWDSDRNKLASGQDLIQAGGQDLIQRVQAAHPDHRMGQKWCGVVLPLFE